MKYVVQCQPVKVSMNQILQNLFDFGLEEILQKESNQKVNKHLFPLKQKFLHVLLAFKSG